MESENDFAQIIINDIKQNSSPINYINQQYIDNKLIKISLPFIKLSTKK